MGVIDHVSIYSRVEDGLFCLPCVLFARKHDLGQFVHKKFNTWSKKTKKFASHNYHQFAITQADSLKSVIQKPASSIDSQLRQIHAPDIAKNRGILKSMAEAVLLCGRQGIALRGHRDDSTA